MLRYIFAGGATWALLLLAAGSFKTLGKKLNTSVKSTYSVLQ